MAIFMADTFMPTSRRGSRSFFDRFPSLSANAIATLSSTSIKRDACACIAEVLRNDMSITCRVCFAFKILAASRIGDNGIAQAFRTAFASIKPNDGMYVGAFPRSKDEIRESAEIVHSILTSD